MFKGRSVRKKWELSGLCEYVITRTSRPFSGIFSDLDFFTNYRQNRP